MYLSRLIRVLFVALSFALVAQALRVDTGAAKTTALAKRQNTDDNDSDSSSGSSGNSGNDSDNDSDNDSESESSEKPTPTTEDKKTTTSERPTPTEDDKETTTSSSSSSSSSSSPQDEETPSESTPAPESSKTTSTTDKDDKPDTTPTPSSGSNDDNDGDNDKNKDKDKDKTTEEPITETHTKVVSTTNSEGRPTQYTTASTSVRTPGLSSDGEDGGSGGMSKQTRNIVIGVVVGVGGAIVLGALAFVAFRIRSRKRAAEPDHFATMESMDKPEEMGHAPAAGPSGAQRNPFQSTLETYHAPTQVNASSNF